MAFPRIKLGAKVIFAVLAAVAAVLGILFFIYRPRRRGETQTDDGALRQVVQGAANQIAAANAQAAVEVAVARTQDAAVKAELKQALAVRDGQERRRRLADLGGRVGL